MAPCVSTARPVLVTLVLLLFAVSTTAQCPQSRTSPAAFSSGAGNYASNTRCEFSLSSPGAYSLSLYFSRFRLAPGDWLAVFDGNSAADPLLGNYTGFIPPSPLKTSTAEASFYIVFQSNSDQLVDLGYAGSFGADRCVSGNRTIGSIHGTVDDGTPVGQLYDNMNSWCYWVFAPPAELSVTGFIVNFVRIDLFSSSSGSYNDVVSFWEGVGSGGRLIDSFSGTVVPNSVKVNVGVFTMGFFKSQYGQAGGFQVDFHANSNVGCAGDPIVLSGPRGSFTSQSPSIYPSNMQCSYIIKGGADYAQSLFFGTFRLDSGDFIKVYDGDSITDPLIGTYTGVLSVPVIKSSTPKRSLLIIFSTDSSNNNGSFFADFYSDRCRKAVSIGSILSGILDDGTPPGQQYDNAGDDCLYMISAPDSAQVTSWTVSFDFIDLYSSSSADYNDFVRFHTGLGAGGAIVATFSGNVVPNSVRILSSSFTVFFRKSPYGAASGWRLRFYANSNTFGCSPPISSSLQLAGPRGRFSSGTDATYLPNQRCQYLLKGSASSSQSLFFSDASIATDDYVAVYDGDSSNDPLIANFSGSMVPGPIRSSTAKNSLFVEFVTNAARNSTGWQADYFSDQCRGTVTTSALQGWISDGTSPGQQYAGVGDWCYWIVKPPADASVTKYLITVEYIDLYSSSSSDYNDYIVIWDGVGSGGAQLASYSGNVVPGTVGTTQSAFTVGFYRSLYGPGTGFRLQFNALSSGVGCMPRANFSGPRGTFTHGTSSSYLNNQYCEFLITGASYSVSLFLSMFRLKPNDWFAVFDGDSTTDAIIGNFSGATPPPPIYSSSSKRSLLVVFKTDGSDTDIGFIANYAFDQCRGNIAMASVSGIISDGTPPGQQYANINAPCLFVVNPPAELGVNQITLSFPKFDLYSSSSGDYNDYLTVYAGPNTGGAVIGSWSGSSNPGTISISASAIAIVFFKSLYGSATGFTASFTTNTACDQPTLTSSSGSYSWSLLPGSPVLCDSVKRWLIRPSLSPASLTVWLSNTLITDDNQINVYDGALPLPALRLASFTNSSSVSTNNIATNPIYSTGGAVLLEYVSRTPVPSTAGQNVPRFTVSYQSQCQGLLTLTDSVGVISDGSGADNYPANTNCQWKITPSIQSVVAITLQPSQISLGSTGSISFLDGNGPSAPLIFRLNATNFNRLNCPFIQSTGPALYVSFAGGASAGGGFSLSYTTGLCNSPASSSVILTDAPSGGLTVTNVLQPLQPCTILLSPRSHIYSQLKLNILYLNFTGATRMNIYDGSNADPDRLLLTYLGGASPPTGQPTAYRGSMLLEIIPDSNTTVRTATLTASFEGSSVC